MALSLKRRTTTLGERTRRIASEECQEEVCVTAATYDGDRGYENSFTGGESGII